MLAAGLAYQKHAFEHYNDVLIPFHANTINKKPSTLILPYANIIMHNATNASNTNAIFYQYHYVLMLSMLMPCILILSYINAIQHQYYPELILSYSIPSMIIILYQCYVSVLLSKTNNNTFITSYYILSSR